MKKPPNKTQRIIRQCLIMLITALFISGTVKAAEYYVATNGKSSASGSKKAPWRSIQKAIDKLKPGDILNIADGLYTGNIKPHVSGSAAAPILIRAISPFNVTLDGGGKGQALNITEVSYLAFEGFKLQNSGEAATLQISSRDRQPATGNTDTHHISLRKLSIKGSCLNKNCNGLLIGRSNNILLEDSWAYGAGRYTVSIYGSRNVTLRRVVVRWDQWYGGSYKVNDPRNALGVYNSHNNLFENFIIIDSGKRPVGAGGDKGALLLAGGDNGKSAPFINSSNNRFYGFVIYNNTGLGLSLSSRVKPHNNNYFENGAIYNNDVRAITISKYVTNTTFNNMTLANHPSEGYANWSSKTSGNVLTNSIVINNGKAAFHGELTEKYNIVFGNSPNYTRTRRPGEKSLIINPRMTSFISNGALPANIPAGSDGKSRGANLQYQYINGEQTARKLWPWRYEAKIKQDFCDLSDLLNLGRVGENTPGLCTSDKSLTDYLPGKSG